MRFVEQSATRLVTRHVPAVQGATCIICGFLGAYIMYLSSFIPGGYKNSLISGCLILLFCIFFLSRIETRSLVIDKQQNIVTISKRAIFSLKKESYKCTDVRAVVCTKRGELGNMWYYLALLLDEGRTSGDFASTGMPWILDGKGRIVAEYLGVPFKSV
jgi:hypothetical protein